MDKVKFRLNDPRLAPLLPLVNVWFLVATLASALVTPLLVLGALAVFAAYV